MKGQLDEWSYLWENPTEFLLVTNSRLFPKHDICSLFDKKDRVYLLIEDDAVVVALIMRMREAGVESIESCDFHPEPSEATKIILEDRAAGLSLAEINGRLKILRDNTIHRY